MEKTVELKDGSEVLIRKMREDDVDRSLAFFQALPEQDRYYLRRGVTERDGVVRRIEAMKAGSVLRLVAVVGDEIVGDGALEFEGHGWKEHVAELRLIVAHAYQQKGLGMLLAREIYLLAEARNVEEIVVRFMAPQIGAQSILTRLGFHKDAEFRDYVQDLGGHKQNLIVMRCKLQELWGKLEDHLAHSDWRRSR
jgi:ribosomal protein S18 acetylase RimI-like enzyme